MISVVCGTCSDEFSAQRSSARYCSRKCQPSRKLRTEHERELARATNRRYYQRLSPEIKLARGRRATAVEKERGYPNRARYRARHRDAVRAATNAWLRSPEGKAWRKAWKRANPNIVRSMKARRRAVDRGAEADRIDLMSLYARDEGCCGICGEAIEFDFASVDHIVPIARGGAHKWDNVQLAHLLCNQRKGVSMPLAETVSNP